MMADEERTVELETSPPAVRGAGQGPLVSVTFQKNPARKQKYLESEPQALGITQICLSVFQISWTGIVLAHNMIHTEEMTVPLIILSVLVIIAGSLAIAAQNLHVPTLRACLAMQVLACVASLFNMTFNVVILGDHHMGYECWAASNYQNVTQHFLDQCYSLENAYTHIYAGFIIVHAALVAISATLAAYCCKVINCCSPAARMRGRKSLPLIVPPCSDNQTKTVESGDHSSS